MSVFMNPVVILISSVICTLGSIYFSYLFLLGNQHSTPNQSLDDRIVSNDRTWIKDVLSPFEPGSSNHNFSDDFGKYYQVNSHCDVVIEKAAPRFDKLVFIVIDALRVDFVPTIERPMSVETLPRMTFMEQRMEVDGIGLLSLATIPTVTLPRIKALLSGKMPSFLDYILNLSSSNSQEDNFVRQLAQKNKRIVFYGDDTWSRLFEPSSPSYSNVKQTFVRANYTSSLFATDFTYVDLNVTWNVKQELKDLNSWDVMILHYLGVDHIGHLKGYHSKLFDAKLQEMDKIFEIIFQTVRSDASSNSSYLFVVTGDHGMTNGGNHGGSTRDETHTAAMFIAPERSDPDKKIKIQPIRSFPLSSRTVMQIDLAPTISSLFQLPLPKDNQGRIISTILDRFNIDKNLHLCHLFQNSLQIQYLIEKALAYNNNNEEFDNNIAILKDNFLKALGYHHKYIHSKDSKNFLYSRKFYQNFLEKVQTDFVKMESLNSSFPLLISIIVVSFIIIFYQLYKEYSTYGSSILFCRPFFYDLFHYWNSFKRIFHYEWFGNANIPLKTPCLYQYLLHYRIVNSSFGVSLALLCVIGPIALMGSVRFLELEHFYWFFVSQAVMLFFVIIFSRALYNFPKSALRKFDNVKNHYKFLLFTSLMSFLTLRLLMVWRRQVLTEDDLNNWDIYTYLNDPSSKILLGAIFTFTLAAIFVMLPVQDDVKMPKSMIIFAFALIYMFRAQSGSIRVLRQPFIQKFLPKADFFAEIFWWINFIIFCNCVFNRIKASLYKTQSINTIRTRLNSFKRTIENICELGRIRSKNDGQLKEFSSFLYVFTIILLLTSSFVIEPAQLPVLAINMALEKMINSIFIVNQAMEITEQDRLCSKGQMFFKLIVYHVMAFTSFYQMGNTNSLSTINVNSCFLGLSSFRIVPCTLFMIISMFSTYFFWTIAYYIRMRQFYESYIRYSCMNLYQNRDNSTIYEIYNRGDLHLLSPSEKEQAEIRHYEEKIHRQKLISKALVEYYSTFTSSISCSFMLRFATMTTNMIVTLVLRHHLFIWSVVCPKLLYELVFTILTFILHFIIAQCFSHDNCFSLELY